MKKLFLSVAAAVMSAASYGQFFTSTTYRGAFGVGAGANWMSGWSNFDPRNAVYPGTGEPGGLAGKTRVDVGGLPFTANNADGLFHITANTTWTSGNVYYLTGPVAVDNGVILTINAGTFVRGTNGGGGVAYLVISRGGQLNANGTSTNPVVMTSDQVQGVRNSGDWGGLMLCGNAQTNLNNPAFHAAGLPRERNFEATATINATRYGRSAGAINNESSGSMTYMRVEFAGDAATLNQELNGIMLAGVGSGTTFNHIQVSYAKDDSYEWFGGTVDAKYLIALGTTDDDFDVDEGFTGRIQFGYILRDPRFYDISGGDASGFIEMDNNTTSSSGSTSSQLTYSPLPVTTATFSNITAIGPLKSGQAASAVSARFGFGFNVRTNPATALFNSLFIGSKNSIVRSSAPTVVGAPTTPNQPSNWTKFSCDSLVAGNNGFIMDPANANGLITVGGFAGSTADCSGAFASKTATDLQNFITLAKYSNTISKTTTTNATNVGIAQPEYSGAIAGVADVDYGFTGTVNMTVVQPWLTGTSVYASGADFTNPKLGNVAAPSITISSNVPSTFGSYTNVTITGTGITTLTGNLNVIGTLTVQSGATLNTGTNSITGSGAVNIQAGANINTTNVDGFTNTITGILRNTGTKTVSTLANYTFNGAVAQTTGGLWAGGNNVTINNAAGVSLTTSAVVNGALNLTSGAFNAGNNLLTIKSSGTQQGVINDVPPTFNGTLGTTAAIRFERYCNSAYSHGVVSPLTGSNSINSVFVPPGMPCNQMKEFSQNQNAWIPVDFNGSGCTDVLPVGLGRMTFGLGARTFTFSGLPVTGTQIFSMNRGAATIAPAPFISRGWNSFGNPYPSAIQWSLMAGVATNAANSALNAYIWNAGANNYGIVTSAGVASGGANNIIGPTQSILVRRATVGTGGPAGALTFNNSVRVTGSNRTIIRKSVEGGKEIRFTLTGSESSDEILMMSGSEAVDAEKAFSPVDEAVSMYIPTQEDPLTIKALDAAETRVPVSVKLPQDGMYTISSTMLKGLAEGTEVILEDKAQNKFMTVSEGFTYAFNGSKGNSSRFAIHFGSAATVKSNLNSGSALIYTNSNELNIRLNNVDASSNAFTASVSDISGRKIVNFQIEGNQLQKSLNVKPGVYTVVVKGNGFSKTQKVIVSSN